MENYQRLMKEEDFASYSARYITGPANHAEYLATALTPERIFQLSVR